MNDNQKTQKTQKTMPLGPEFYNAVAKYAAKYRDETIVIKFGGELVDREETVRAIAIQAINLVNLGANVVLVHGGGNQIDAALKSAGIEPKKRDGVRDTDAPTLEITDECLATLNRKIAKIFYEESAKMGAHVYSQGMSGYDGGAIKATPKFEGTQTGTVSHVNAHYFQGIAAQRTVPIVYPICAGENGSRMNVNADDVAASLAIHLGARRLILCSNVAGVLDQEGARIPQIDTSKVDGLISDGTITGGMIPKIKACQQVAENPHVGGVVILDGTDPSSVETELLSTEGAGTLIHTAVQKAAPALQRAI